MPLKEIIALNISLLVIVEGYGVPLTTIECKNALLKAVLTDLHKFHVIDGQNTRDQIAFSTFHSFTKRSRLHMSRACVIATCILGFQASFVARNNR